MPDAPVTPALHALCAYAEPLVAGRRVLVVDDASRGVGGCLVGLGARVVHVYDPDGRRARQGAAGAPRGLTVQELPVGEFDVRDGAFDVAILPDLGLVVEPAALLARVRRLLGDRGVAMVCSYNAAAKLRLAAPPANAARAIDYYELFDLAALQFAHVRMIGLVPFVGVALAELGLKGEPELSVDTQLAGDGDPPELFVALASHDGTRLADYAIVQLSSQLLDAPRAESRPRPQARDREAEREQAALAEAQLRASVLAAQLEEAHAKAGAAEEANRGRRGLGLELEASLAATSAQLRVAEARAAEQQVLAERLAQEVQRVAEELLAERHHRARLEAELGAVRRGPDPAEARDRADALELSLRAAEDAIAALRARVADLEAQRAMGEEQIAALAIALDESRSIQVDPEALARLARLAERTEAADARAAAMEAELTTIAEAHSGELVQLEVGLRERGQALKALEAEVLRREHMVHELVAALEEHAHSAASDARGADVAAARELPIAQAEAAALRRELEAQSASVARAAVQLDRLRAENDALRTKLDALALEAARREGELTTRGWRVTELEQALAARDHGRPAAAGTVDASAVARLEDELDALRQALTQEHAERTRAESGEELTTARAELARQATLIEQLSRELDGQDRASLPGAAREARSV